MRDWLTGEGLTPRPGTPQQFMAEMTAAAEELRDLLRQAKIRLD